MAVWFNSTAIIVDDSYPNIAYSGQWYKEGSTNEYMKTTHGSACGAGGCTFTFSFLGAAVEVLGTTSAGQNPVVQFQMDALPVSVYEQGATSDTTYGHLFYSSPTLDPGQHTLTATITNADTLWVDYILYTPSIPSGINVPLSMTSDVLALPSSLSGILAWSPIPSSPSPSSLSPPSVVLSSFPPSPSSPSVSSPSPQPLDSPLPPTLTASSPNVPSPPSLPPPSSLVSTAHFLPLPSNSPLTQSFPPVPSASSSSAPPATVNDTSSGASARSSLVGPIVGGVVGGVSVLAILLALVWWRRRKAKAGPSHPSARRSSRAPSPFLQRRSAYHEINKARAMTMSSWHREHYSEASTPDTPLSDLGLERRSSRSYSHSTHASHTPYAYNATTAFWDPALGSGESLELVPSLSEREFSRQRSMSDLGVSRRVYYDDIGDVPPPYSGRE